MRDRFGIFSTVIRIRKLSLLLVMMLRIPNNCSAAFSTTTPARPFSGRRRCPDQHPMPHWQTKMSCRHHNLQQKNNNKEEVQKTSCRTHRSERLCVAAKNLLLVLPVAVAASAPPSCVGSVCGAGGSLVTRPAVVGATSGRLHGLLTSDGAASSS